MGGCSTVLLMVVIVQALWYLRSKRRVRRVRRNERGRRGTRRARRKLPVTMWEVLSSSFSAFAGSTDAGNDDAVERLTHRRELEESCKFVEERRHW